MTWPAPTVNLAARRNRLIGCLSSLRYGQGKIISDTLPAAYGLAASRPHATQYEYLFTVMKKLFATLSIMLIIQGCAWRGDTVAAHDPLDDFGPMLAAASEESNISLLCGDTDWPEKRPEADRKSTRLNSSHVRISY